MGREAQTEQRLVRQEIVECRRGVAGHDQSALDIANIKGTRQDPEQAQNTKNSRKKTRRKSFRIGIWHHEEPTFARLLDMQNPEIAFSTTSSCSSRRCLPL